jgi:thiol:disulfide interchange protein
MRHIFSILTLILIAGIATFGQGPEPAVKDTAANPKTAAFVRERFDPKRDPAADLADAVKDASASGKRIILDVGGEWCGWCIFMDKFFFQNPDLAKIRDDNFVWVKVNFSPLNENQAFFSAYPVPTGFPHLYVLDPAGKLLHSHNTSDLERGDSYDLQKFIAFLKKWSPKNNPKIDLTKKIK